MDVLITTAADGVVTIHRGTCKKIEERVDTLGVEEVLEANPGSLTTAKKGSCCKPTDATMNEVEQAGWDALEAAANSDAPEDSATDTEDLIGEEDLIGTPEPAPKKTAAKVAKAKTEARELNGLESLTKVAAHLDIALGKKPVFPGFGKAFKTADKQSVYVNSKGNADVRATDAAQADAWAALDHVERRSGNYVRVNLAAL